MGDRRSGMSDRRPAVQADAVVGIGSRGFGHSWVRSGSVRRDRYRSARPAGRSEGSSRPEPARGTERELASDHVQHATRILRTPQARLRPRRGPGRLDGADPARRRSPARALGTSPRAAGSGSDRPAARPSAGDQENRLPRAGRVVDRARQPRRGSRFLADRRDTGARSDRHRGAQARALTRAHCQIFAIAATQYPGRARHPAER
jgi:hypothetical protein